MKRRLIVVLFLAAMGLVLGARWLAAAEPVVENLDFIEADIRDVFRSLGIAGKYNVLLTKEVQGAVTISLRQAMTIKDAIDLIARTYEFDLRWLNDDRTVIIGKTSTLKSSFDANVKMTKVFSLCYSTVAEIADALKVAVNPNQISTNTRTNQITVVGAPLEVENAEEIIAQMDHPMPQVNIEARMEEVAETSLSDLGLTWTTTLPFGVGPGLSIVSYPQVTATLKALEQKGKASLLAQPNASCLDSQQATIFIGDRVPVIMETVKDNTITYLIDYREVGTKLVVNPRVNMENIVTVKVTADVSSITDWRAAGTNQIPVIRSRTTESMARLRDGQTFVLTGLMQRDETSTDVGVPFLDKLPVLSALFKTKKVDAKNTVICVFLTPHIQRVTADEVPTAQIRSGGALSPVSPALVPAPAPAGTVPGLPPASPAESGSVPAGTAPGSAPAAPPEQGTGTSQPLSPAPDAAQAPSMAVPPQPAEPPVEEGGESAEEMAEAASAAPPAGPVIAPDTPAVPSGPAAAGGEQSGATETGSTAPAGPAVPPPPAPAAEPAAPEGGTAGPAETGEAAPEVADPSVRQVLPRPEDIKDVEYRVKKGDSLAAIGRKFGVPYQEIAAYNGLSPKATLHPGQSLRIPIPDSHKYVVKPKETLWRIAKRYGVTVELLVEINNLTDSTKIEVGQVIVLPCPVDRVVNPSF